MDQDNRSLEKSHKLRSDCGGSKDARLVRYKHEEYHMSDRIEIWDLWFPDAAAQGLPFARGRLRATDLLLVHAAPAILRVDVVDERGTLLARSDRLPRTAETPITRLRRQSGRIERTDIWPGEPEI